MLPLLLLLWILAGVIVGAAAAGRGRSGLGWFLYGFLLWPVALMHLLVLPKTDARLRHEARLAAEAQARPDVARPAPAEQRIPCPFCAERILPAARLCPFCRSELTPAAPAELPRDVPILGPVLATDGIPGEVAQGRDGERRKPGSVSPLTWCWFILGASLLLIAAYALGQQR